MLARAIAAAGHVVVAEAADGESAVAAAARERPEALVLDSRLPPGDAPETVVRIRAVAPEAAIYIFASLEELATVRAAVAAGAAGAIVRPLRPSGVADALGREPA